MHHISLKICSKKCITSFLFSIIYLVCLSSMIDEGNFHINVLFRVYFVRKVLLVLVRNEALLQKDAVRILNNKY